MYVPVGIKYSKHDVICYINYCAKRTSMQNFQNRDLLNISLIFTYFKVIKINIL